MRPEKNAGSEARHELAVVRVRAELVRLAPAPPLFVGEVQAAKKFWEFFANSIRNAHTRRAYYRAVCRFAATVGARRVSELAAVEPSMIGPYVEALAESHSIPTAKQHLAALRKLFDFLVVGHVLKHNPAHAVRGPKWVVQRGKTPVLAPDDVRALFDAIDPKTVLGARDRALIGVMVYTFARIGAARSMRLQDYYTEGRAPMVRLLEKGSKRRDLPVHRVLRRYLDHYIKKAGLVEEKAWLFQSMKGGKLTGRRLSQADAYRMVGRRVQAAALAVGKRIGNHSWRATGITTYLNQGGSLEKAQDIAGHASARTTRLYDRREDSALREEIERIQF